MASMAMRPFTISALYVNTSSNLAPENAFIAAELTLDGKYPLGLTFYTTLAALMVMRTNATASGTLAIIVNKSPLNVFMTASTKPTI